jgi:NAD+ diphosphatase
LAVSLLIDGEALSENIILDEEELADARWFSREHVKKALAGEATDLSLPGKLAIARYLIERWVIGSGF